MESRHSRHTGRREIFTREIPQSLQSEGKKTEKTLRTAVTIGATRELRCSARSTRRCRSRVARLLKTTSSRWCLLAQYALILRPWGESTEAISIVASCARCNVVRRSSLESHRHFISFHCFHPCGGASIRSPRIPVRRGRMGARSTCPCTKCCRHANLRRHNYLGYRRGLCI
jgi:hypothetical protein